MIFGMSLQQILVLLVVIGILYYIFTRPCGKECDVKPEEIIVELGPGNLAVFRYSPEMSQMVMVREGHDVTEQVGLGGLKEVTCAVAFDLNKDGFSDLILGGPEMGLWIYENRIHGQFRSGGFIGNQVLKGNGEDILSVLIHDFNRNGNADLIVQYADLSEVLLKYVGGSGHGGSNTLSYQVMDPSECSAEMATTESKIPSGPGGNEVSSVAKDIYQIAHGIPESWHPMSEDSMKPYQFAVKLPNNIEFANAKVMLRIGRQHVVKYNLAGMGENGLIVFGFDRLVPIDGVKIRTIYGKAHSYASQKMGTLLRVSPIVKFDSSLNTHRSQSMG